MVRIWDRKQFYATRYRTRYSENPDLLGDTPDPIWAELANLLKAQAIEAINQAEPNY